MSEQEITRDENELTTAVPPDSEDVETPSVDETATPPTAESAESDEVPAEAAPDASSPPPTDPALPTSIHELREGQKLQGKVKTITEFGAFVDLGIAQDGLIHISELARGRVEKVSDVVSEGDEVTVWVKKVDKKRGRISLTLLKPIVYRWRDLKEDAVLEAEITRLEPYGAFADIGAERDGLIHVSELTHGFIESPEEVVTVGDKVQVKVLKVNRKKRQVDLSIKALQPAPQSRAEDARPQAREEEPETVEAEEAPTAMALAFQAALGEIPTPAKEQGKQTRSKGKRRKQQELDNLIHRTLENQKN